MTTTTELLLDRSRLKRLTVIDSHIPAGRNGGRFATARRDVVSLAIEHCPDLHRGDVVGFTGPVNVRVGHVFGLDAEAVRIVGHRPTVEHDLWANRLPVEGVEGVVTAAAPYTDPGGHEIVHTGSGIPAWALTLDNGDTTVTPIVGDGGRFIGRRVRLDRRTVCRYGRNARCWSVVWAANLIVLG